MTALSGGASQRPTILRRRAFWVLAALTGLCLTVFLAAIPLPRADGQLIGSDGVGYYVYLPSFWLDHDLDFTDEYAYYFPAPPPPGEIPFYTQQTARGVPPNQWSIGPALLWSPFFLAAHGLFTTLAAMGLPVEISGYGLHYQAAVLIGGILYAGVGLWLTYAFARVFVDEGAALAATVLIALAGNLVYYMTAEPSMSHIPSCFVSGLFFYTWVRRRDRTDLLTPLLLGAIAGLGALVRPQDGLFLLLPILHHAPVALHGIRNHDMRKGWLWLRFAVLAAGAAFLLFFLQILTWGVLYGDLLRSGYAYGEDRFYWLEPRLGEVLFSAERGLFVWHPVFLLALVGLAMLHQRDRCMTVLGFLGVAIQWYLIASWGNWMQGDAFGGRMFIVCTPIFVLGLARLIEATADQWSWRAVLVVSLVLLFWNFLLFVEYRFVLVTAQRAVDWHDLTVGRLTRPVDLILRRLQ
ncbi:hypothetical protein [Caldilinea sp.]|uniref:hypothetical protein n=1 Tax=Caldilinea sp. TaxID=2293560 RepID=UPI002CD9B438|nr:hypothetical protein [Caldilinea sp.]